MFTRAFAQLPLPPACPPARFCSAPQVNRILAAHKKKHQHPVQYKIGPDPSSIDSCMVGGIVSNNSSGMCCGVSQNTYHTLKDMRIVLVDGTGALPLLGV